MTKVPGVIRFHFLSPCSLPSRSLLKAYIHSIFIKEKTTLDRLNVIFCSDEYLLDLNIRFLNHDYYTDILSFPLSGHSEPLDGEIYISVDRVKENAVKNNTLILEELHRVIFHGILHFCSYSDHTAAEKHRMRNLENDYLAGYNLFRAEFD